MNVLVTGGAGYIGAHTCKQLAEHGFAPVVLDNLVYGHKEAVRWGPFVAGDIHDTALVTRVLQEHSIAAVLHFAAFAFVGESVTRPDLYYQNNVVGTLSLLQAMRAANVRHLVFSSTCATYGTPQAVPMGESHPQIPVNPYGVSKHVVERMLRDFHSAFGLSSVALRYFNAAGADPGGEIGESHTPETHLIPLALAAVTGNHALTIFGDDYPTPDGTCIRDYIHVTDLADAHVLALRHLLAATAPQALAYNLGNGRGFSVRDVLATVQSVTGKPVPHTVGARRAGDPPRLVADATLAKSELHWTTRFADLQQIIATAWAWHCKSHKA